MKVLVVEVEMNEYKTTYYTNLNCDSGVVWENGCKDFQITEELFRNIQRYHVIGWVAGVNRFGKPVKRTYMLIPE